MTDIRRHPSGKPIRRDVRKGYSIIRNPGIGPLVPRLREPELRDAIGFHRFVIPSDDNQDK